MRKLLLATSALLSASVGFAGLGHAGTLTPNAPNPAPGSITVTLNALVEAMMIAGSDSGTLPENFNGNKVQNYGIATYVRLYPSFDGVLANGIKYGASVELRQNQGFAGTSSQNAVGEDLGTMYVQRGFVYVGTDHFGKVSLGSPVQPTELFQTGNPANFNTGGWDGDVPGFFRWGLPYFFSDTNDRANKIVYVSPQFSGFDFGLSFEPNNYGNDYAKPFTRVTSASSTSIITVDPITGVETTTTAQGLQYGRRVNTVDGAARYQGTFGAVGFKADLGGSYGGTVRSNGGTAVDPVTGVIVGIPGAPNYKNYTMLTGGVSVTFGGLEFDAMGIGGQFGPSLAPTLSGHTDAWITGVSYTIGPVIFGAAYNGFSSGYTASVSGNSTHGYGIAAGGTYTLAPGASVFLEYLYGHQHANGVDLVNGGASVDNNNTRAQAFGIGTAFKW